MDGHPARRRKLPRAGRRDRRARRHGARRRHGGAAVRDRERDGGAARRRPLRARERRPERRGQSATRLHAALAGRHDQSGFQPDRVGRRPRDGERALRPVHPGEATVLSRGHRALLHARAARLHASDRRPGGRRKAHGEDRAVRRGASHGLRRRERQRRPVQHHAASPRLRRQLRGRRHGHRSRGAGTRVQSRRGRRRASRLRPALLLRDAARRLLDARRRGRHSSGADLEGRIGPHRARLGVQLRDRRARRGFRESRRLRAAHGDHLRAFLQPLLPLRRARRPARELHHLLRPEPRLGLRGFPAERRARGARPHQHAVAPARRLGHRAPGQPRVLPFRRGDLCRGRGGPRSRRHRAVRRA